MAESTAPNSILLFGVTGTIGKHITESLLAADPPFRSVTAFTSSSTTSSKADLLARWAAKGLSIIEGDIYSEADVKRAYSAGGGVDTVVSCLGRNVLGHQTELLRWAEDAPGSTVRLFLPSEYGTDVAYSERSKDEKPHQMKLKVRRFVEERIRRINVIYLVTGPYPEMFVTLNPGMEEVGGYDVKSKRAVLISDSKPVGFTTMPDVGKGVVAAIRHAQAGGPFGLVDGRETGEGSSAVVVKMQSFVATPQEILDAFQAQMGSSGEPWKEVRHSTLDQVKALERETWEKGNPAATLVTLRRIWAEGGTLYEKTDNATIGLRDNDMETLADVVARAIKSA